MERSVEHIVETHRIASSLRAKGKKIWSYHINMYAILDEDRENEAPEHLAATAKRVASLFRSKLPESFFDFNGSNYDASFVEVIEDMESWTAEQMHDENKTGGDSLKMFHEWLAAIYDFSDINRIWLR